uniref:Uncharacterized protein n=1 Tax=uncultured prokaryote TaxID=198431 RepID=A0A0H5Q8R4_9ZZZZ|nr:hypothetical protein [uncultured prokaryote]
MNTVIESLREFIGFTGFANMTLQHLLMICIGIFFIVVAIKKEWEPLLLIPIGFGMIIGNIPFVSGLNIGIYEQGSVMNILYQGVQQGWYPPLIFLGIGAMTDFSALLLLYIFFGILGGFNSGKYSLKKAFKRTGKGKETDAETAAAIAMALNDEFSEEVYAAIGLALEECLNDTVHDQESYIITIKRK